MKVNYQSVVSLFKVIFATVFVTGIGQLLSVLVGIVLARAFTMGQYGHYMFAFTIAKMGSQLCLLGAVGLLAKQWGACSRQGFAREKYVFGCALSLGLKALLCCFFLIAVFWCIFYFQVSMRCFL